MHGKNLRIPACERRAGAMRQFPSGELDSMGQRKPNGVF
jgi:hypothetical protein